MAKNCSLPYLYRTCPLDRVCSNIGVRKPNLYNAIEYVSEKDPYFTQQNTRLKMVLDKFNKELEDYINRTLENGSELWNLAKDEKERAQRERKANKEQKKKQREMYEAESNAKDVNNNGDDADETLEKKRSSKKRKNNPNDDFNDDLAAQIAKMEELLTLERKDKENLLRQQQQQQQQQDDRLISTATSSASQQDQNVPIRVLNSSGKEFKYTMIKDPKTGQPIMLLESD